MTCACGAEVDQDALRAAVVDHLENGQGELLEAECCYCPECSDSHGFVFGLELDEG